MSKRLGLWDFRGSLPCVSLCAIVSNAGHFIVEIDIPTLAKMATGEPREVRDFVNEYVMEDGRKIFILGQCHGHVVRQPGLVGGIYEPERQDP